MGLVKQPVALNFGRGVDTKTDPFQVDLGNFLALKNSVFTVGRRLTKRNGFGPLAALPSMASFATTFNNDLTAIGTNIQVYSPGSDSWVSKGAIQPLSLSTLPVIRNNLNQIQADTAVAANGFACTVYSETDGTTTSYKYVVADSVSGQNIVAPTAISGADATLGTPRVFLMGGYFVIVYTNKVTTTYHLKFVAISVANPSTVTAATDISTSYTPAASVAFDGAVLNGALYLAWNGASTSGIKMAYISPTLAVSSTVNPDAAHVATIMSVCADVQNGVIWASYYDSGGSTGYSLAVSPALTLLTHFPVQIITTGTILNLASSAASGVMTVFYETSHTDNSIQTNFVSSRTVTQSSGAVGSAVVVLRSVGLASKAFIMNGSIYFLAAYSSPYQPTYFLVNGSSSTSAAPLVVAKLAYENGGGYLTKGLPSVAVSGSTAQIAYLIKDLVEALSNANAAGTSVVGGVYSQTGINHASFTFGDETLNSAEIGSNLNITGGFLYGYDGYLPVEQGFHLWPSSVQNTATATTGGHLAAQIYFYQAVYEWTDNQGNAFRSAGSIPVKADISGAGTSTSTLTIVVPTLRITAKVANAVKIVLYRWSTAQQTFYQVTSISAPTLNDTTVDSVTYVDTLADASIVGNNILYTTGGVVENVGGPSFASVFTFDDRLWGITSEDSNLLWYSKQVIESTPVEFSDLLTVYVAPSIGAQGPTGPLKCGAQMDDKAILFKPTALYYINGTGPDNTGANNQYSQPTFITSMVGCSNQASIVFQPQGLMFEFASEAGNQIWIVKRDLSTEYIGAPVEALTKNARVLSALSVPGTNQVRFNLDSGETIFYDYYYGQWGTNSTDGASSTLYQGLHTYIDSRGAVFKETPGLYLNGSSPVLLSFTTSWIKLAGIRGYQRAYFVYLLGQYLSPFKLICSIAYDYESSPSQFVTINPTNFSPTLGSAEEDGQEVVLGQATPLGGASNVLNWRIFLKKQRCSAIQISVQEVYDPSFGVPAGAGFYLSGLTLIAAIKSGFKTISAAHSVGTK